MKLANVTLFGQVYPRQYIVGSAGCTSIELLPSGVLEVEVAGNPSRFIQAPFVADGMPVEKRTRAPKAPTPAQED